MISLKANNSRSTVSDANYKMETKRKQKKEKKKEKRNTNRNLTVRNTNDYKRK